MKSDRTLILIAIAFCLIIAYMWWATIKEGRRILTSGNRELQKEQGVVYYSDENGFKSN